MFYRLIYITILIIELIECVFGVNYVDVKNYNISRGVNVFYGRFNKFGKYFMFVGDLEPITQLRFGNELIFPNDTGSNNYNLFVEMFIKNNIKLVSFYVHTFHKGLLKEVKRKVISISCDTYSYISNEEFMFNIDKPILVSVDIGPKPKHPFITRFRSGYEFHIMFEYEMIKEYQGFKFDGITGPQYMFGYVYDLDHPVVVGYTKRPYLTDESVVIKIFNSHYSYNNIPEFITVPFVIEFKVKHEHSFELRPILGKNYWFLVEYTEEFFSNPTNKYAIKLYRSYMNHQSGIPLLPLDISELVSYEIFGMKKVTGLAKYCSYTLYTHERKCESDYRIKVLIDSQIYHRTIDVQRTTYINYNLEVYKDNGDTYVIISFNIEKAYYIIKESKIYIKKIGREKFKKEYTVNHGLTMKMITKWYPIKLDITIDKEQPSLFEKKEISNKELTIYHFSINETNDFGESILNKYVFGRVYQTTSFQFGNIPQEPFRKHRVMIVGDINTNKFIVRNKSTLDNLSTPQYQLFRLRI
ncbi:hypothetical protein TpMuguga_03g00902 [Theileria parva strain Muguga]|uniref:Uncharacterized protein n=1 Tax=Theileria parva TaxID=5875 RepID=Q4MZQ5_THEPA|nr:uncharacterized protein TpMuguga_03g00902 [Theileria parva strain Muguga]EAN31206.1 hypothetical protein TpMuguga_03g00902 [Theileria parva strain Muguga]|eukprot:XP_763489.1 hypothetical protein [Theileria parva strain Muguga]